MQGIYINYERPKSKKVVKEGIAAIVAGEADPASVRLEAASMFGNEYDGSISDAPDGDYHFVGPDPHTSRKFYGTITKSGETIKVK